jgi:hypothetical protein
MIFDTCSFHQFSKFNNFLWVYQLNNPHYYNLGPSGPFKAHRPRGTCYSNLGDRFSNGLQMSLIFIRGYNEGFLEIWKNLCL